jgi:hypothetical protein
LSLGALGDVGVTKTSESGRVGRSLAGLGALGDVGVTKTSETFEDPESVGDDDQQRAGP